MTEEQHGLHEEPRPNAPRRVSAVEREREWLAKQYSKEREAYREADTVCQTEPDSFTSVEPPASRSSISVAPGSSIARGVRSTPVYHARAPVARDSSRLVD